jgi:hypothetical protein
LAVRPTRRDRGAYRGFVLGDAVHECRNETHLSALDPTLLSIAATITIGVDVSKDHLDAHRLADGAARRFANDKRGHKAPIEWLAERPADQDRRQWSLMARL